MARPALPILSLPVAFFATVAAVALAVLSIIAPALPNETFAGQVRSDGGVDVQHVTQHQGSMLLQAAQHVTRDAAQRVLEDDAKSGVGHEVPYPSVIRSISIVMAAYNEHAYVAKTVESIQATTPPEVLKEIIVVDDGSSPPMATDLTKHKEVTVIRHENHRGLIQSKVDGGNAATGDMIMFLDAHVKPEKDWYKPLLEHVNINYRRAVVPVIPTLNATTWEPNMAAVGYKMMFNWGLSFSWFDDGNDEVPCMSGGLFGISRQWWHESGEYDYGMKMWGGENIEQSIRLWLCGGEIYVARKSFVSHVFRTKFPYAMNSTEFSANKVRTVETWFDDYKEKYYHENELSPQHKLDLRGDISERLALKKRLHCKPFQWYVDKFQKVFEMKGMIPKRDSAKEDLPL